MDDVVVTKGLSKTFGSHMAVEQINMTIHKGDIYGLIGQNGAGKTTFMRMICGLATPTGGSMELFGSNDLQMQRQKLGCTIENPALYPTMTARENMEVYRILFGIQEPNVISDLLELVGLEKTQAKKAKDFSLGMKQRLMIAIALIGNPELLILDEPMNGLDPFGIKEIRELLLMLNQEKKMTILVSSHILDELSKIATRYGVINNGRMIKEFSMKELEEDCRHKMKLTVTNSTAAISLLQNNFTANLYREANGDIILYDHIDQVVDIVNSLVSHGIGVSSVIPQEQNLEEYFMSLIGGNIA